MESSTSDPSPVSDEEQLGAPPSAAEMGPPQDPTRLDHFEVERMIGKGGMGEVYLGRDTSLDRLVALKVLPADIPNREVLQQRFLREARAQAQLQSAHVAHIFFIGKTPKSATGRSSLYFAMELIDGGSLSDTLDRGETLDPERARVWMLQIARGLADAQRAGIIHRDIKPSNLLLDKSGAVKIVDFGVAKPVDDEMKLTQFGVVVGSPHYMAPEQAMAETLDFRADMYALGCTFYHLLKGEPPFDAANPFAIVNKHCNEPFPDVNTTLPKVPAATRAVLERLTRKAPAERYGSYDELIVALEDAAPKDAAYASFGARGAGFAVDIVLAGLAVGFAGWFGLALYLVYGTVAHARFGKTIGKHVMRVRVQRVDGSPLSVGRSALRTVASLWLPFVIALFMVLTQGTGVLVDTIESMNTTELAAFQTWIIAAAVNGGVLSLAYLAGLAMAAFHPKGQAIHDLLVGSVVVYDLSEGVEKAIGKALARTPSALIPRLGKDVNKATDRKDADA